MLPEFLVKRIPKQKNIRKIRDLLNNTSIHTVCESAHCPNIGECFSGGTCTFLILGNICTRNCAFCGVNHGEPQPPDPEEPKRIAEAVRKLNLNYAVITSVARDDLPDGGANQFAAVINKLQITNYKQHQNYKLQIEALIPDFQGSEKSLKTVLDAHPYVLNHNLETVPRLYPKIRPQADYRRSLKILKFTKEYRPPNPDRSPEGIPKNPSGFLRNIGRRRVCTKSGFMVGLGETQEEVVSVIEDLRRVRCDRVTIGQYLPPSRAHPRVERYVQPEEFEAYKRRGEKIGLKVAAGPFVRSSYQAHEAI